MYIGCREADNFKILHHIFSCGFDGGDCGTKNLHQLFSHTLEKRSNGTHVKAPKGTIAMFVNLTNVFDTIIEGW